MITMGERCTGLCKTRQARGYMERNGYIHRVAQTGQLRSYACRILIEFSMSRISEDEDRQTHRDVHDRRAERRGTPQFNKRPERRLLQPGTPPFPPLCWNPVPRHDLDAHVLLGFAFPQSAKERHNFRDTRYVRLCPQLHMSAKPKLDL